MNIDSKVKLAWTEEARKLILESINVPDEINNFSYFRNKAVSQYIDSKNNPFRYIVICLNNDGFEDSFEIGIEYICEDERYGMMRVIDMLGEVREVSHFKFKRKTLQ